MTNKIFLQIDLMQLCAIYLSRTKKEPTLWDLINTMSKVMHKIDKINAKGKKISFNNFSAVIDETWLNKFGLIKDECYNKGEDKRYEK